MKVAIVNLTAGGMSGGYPKYLRNIVPRLARHSEIDSILCATPASISLKMDHEHLPRVHFVPCRPLSIFGRDSELDARIGEFQPDIVYVPVERPFAFRHAPVVTMLQNMEPFICPLKGNPVFQKIKGLLRLRYAAKAVTRADRIIALSAFVKNHLIEHCRIPETRIGLVYHGVETGNGGPVERPASLPPDWTGGFLFTAGSIRPARGLEDLLGALKCLLELGKDLPGVVIAGEAESAMVRYRAKLIRWTENNRLAAKIVWAGHLTESEMAWCYRHCRAFIMTSRVESFGQTAVEALAHGAPCIAADNPCLPEIFSEAAIYYPPRDAAALARAIGRIIAADERERKELVEKARRRARAFSWDICADRTIAQFSKALDRQGAGRTS